MIFLILRTTLFSMGTVCWGCIIGLIMFLLAIPKLGTFYKVMFRTACVVCLPLIIFIACVGILLTCSSRKI